MSAPFKIHAELPSEQVSARETHGGGGAAAYHPSTMPAARSPSPSKLGEDLAKDFPGLAISLPLRVISHHHSLAMSADGIPPLWRRRRDR